MALPPPPDPCCHCQYHHHHYTYHCDNNNSNNKTNNNSSSNGKGDIGGSRLQFYGLFLWQEPPLSVLVAAVVHWWWLVMAWWWWWWLSGGGNSVSRSKMVMAEGQLIVAVYLSLCMKISCSVKIILKTSILSDFDPFMGSQQFLCTHKSQILFTNVQ